MKLTGLLNGVSSILNSKYTSYNKQDQFGQPKNLMARTRIHKPKLIDPSAHKLKQLKINSFNFCHDVIEKEMQSKQKTGKNRDKHVRKLQKKLNRCNVFGECPSKSQVEDESAPESSSKTTEKSESINNDYVKPITDDITKKFNRGFSQTDQMSNKMGQRRSEILQSFHGNHNVRRQGIKNSELITANLNNQIPQGVKQNLVAYKKNPYNNLRCKGLGTKSQASSINDQDDIRGNQTNILNNSSIGNSVKMENMSAFYAYQQSSLHLDIQNMEHILYENNETEEKTDSITKKLNKSCFSDDFLYKNKSKQIPKINQCKCLSSETQKNISFLERSDKSITTKSLLNPMLNSQIKDILLPTDPRFVEKQIILVKISYEELSTFKNQIGLERSSYKKYIQLLREYIIDFNQITKMNSDALDKIFSVLDMNKFKAFVDNAKKIDSKRKLALCFKNKENSLFLSPFFGMKKAGKSQLEFLSNFEISNNDKIHCEFPFGFIAFEYNLDIPTDLDYFNQLNKSDSNILFKNFGIIEFFYVSKEKLFEGDTNKKLCKNEILSDFPQNSEKDLNYQNIDKKIVRESKANIIKNMKLIRMISLKEKIQEIQDIEKKLRIKKFLHNKLLAYLKSRNQYRNLQVVPGKFEENDVKPIYSMEKAYLKNKSVNESVKISDGIRLANKFRNDSNFNITSNTKNQIHAKKNKIQNTKNEIQNPKNEIQNPKNVRKIQLNNNHKSPIKRGEELVLDKFQNNHTFSKKKQKEENYPELKKQYGVTATRFVNIDFDDVLNLTKRSIGSKIGSNDKLKTFYKKLEAKEPQNNVFSLYHIDKSKSLTPNPKKESKTKFRVTGTNLNQNNNSPKNTAKKFKQLLEIENFDLVHKAVKNVNLHLSNSNISDQSREQNLKYSMTKVQIYESSSLERLDVVEDGPKFRVIGQKLEKAPFYDNNFLTNGKTFICNNSRKLINVEKEKTCTSIRKNSNQHPKEFHFVEKPQKNKMRYKLNRRYVGGNFTDRIEPSIEKDMNFNKKQLKSSGSSRQMETINLETYYKDSQNANYKPFYDTIQDNVEPDSPKNKIRLNMHNKDNYLKLGKNYNNSNYLNVTKLDTENMNTTNYYNASKDMFQKERACQSTNRSKNQWLKQPISSAKISNNKSSYLEPLQKKHQPTPMNPTNIQSTQKLYNYEYNEFESWKHPSQSKNSSQHRNSSNVESLDNSQIMQNIIEKKLDNILEQGHFRNS